MVGQGVGDADRWTLVDETLEETLSFQELQFVRERPARDPSKEMLQLIESLRANDVQGTEDLDGPTASEDTQRLDGSLNLPCVIVRTSRMTS